MPVRCCAAVLILAICTVFALGRVAAAEPASPFVSPLGAADLDPAAFSQWLDGVASPVELKDGPRRLLWTRDSHPECLGVTYGDGRSQGPRHLRIGWKTACALGTVLIRGGGQVSVLAPSATYPGDPGDDRQWLPATRLDQSTVSTVESQREDYHLWVLPPGTMTRALRLTHVPSPTDPSYAGWIGGVALLAGRYANVATQATVIAVHSPEKAGRLVDEANDSLSGMWDNGSAGGDVVVSADHPEIMTLVWPQPMTMDGLTALSTGFGAAEVWTYTGPADRHPREAGSADWTKVATFSDLVSGYPMQLWPNWLDFRRQLTTRAIQVRLTATVAESHPHLKDTTKNGKRVWLGELLVLSALAGSDLASLAPPPAPAPPHPPIAVPFSLAEPGFVTLVIEDAQGHRVRNLVSETRFPAGKNIAWWDGMDDHGRDQEAARHGIYHVPGDYIAPGTYTVRGLWRRQLDLRYEMSVYNAGSPAWLTADGTGGWGTTHTAPRCVVSVPAARAPGGKALVYIGSYVAEGGHGLFWVDHDGHKVGGTHWVGGLWTGAQFLASDDGEQADPAVAAYVAASWEHQLRLTAVGAREQNCLAEPLPASPDFDDLAGFAARDGLLFCSLGKAGRIEVIDVKSRKRLAGLPCSAPGGLAFDQQGRLLVLACDRLLRYVLPGDFAAHPVLPAASVVVGGLDEPQALTCDAQGRIYISLRGRSHQVRVVGTDGTTVRSIGVPGVPVVGPYDPNHMNNPAGVTIDGEGRLWVAEEDHQPKRVSVWSAEGVLLKAFYGPSRYGGGGTLDPLDARNFYLNGMEFHLDHAHGTETLARVLFRPGAGQDLPPDAHASDGLPESSCVIGGQRYFTNWNNSNPTNGCSLVSIWADRGGVAVPVGLIGQARGWKGLTTPAFRAAWPAGIDPTKDDWQRDSGLLVTWSDRNRDGRMQVDELHMRQIGDAWPGGFTVAADLSVVLSRAAGRTLRFSPSFTGDVPSYDLAAGEVLAEGVLSPASSGGDQALSAGPWTFLTLGVQPFARESLSGVCAGKVRWSYPNVWPGLHASHEAGMPEFPGEVIGTTRVLGTPIDPPGSTVGPMVAVNGNMGPMYLFTVDGLFVATLFQDVRVGRSWSMPVGTRGMLLNDVSPHDENFWPTITQTAAGEVFVVDGARTSLVRVDGLASLRRLPDAALVIGTGDLDRARAFAGERELARQRAQGSGVMRAAITTPAPQVDGDLADWTGADWVAIDRRGVAANFNSTSRPYDVAAAARVAGDRLYLAWRTTEADLLRNSGGVENAPFKSGGALDLMLGSDASADPTRAVPVAGDQRLLITRVKERTFALLYRAVVPGTAHPVAFSSPWRTITIDRVEDVSASVVLASSPAGYEVSVPLATLGLAPKPGLRIRADIGVLRGDGMQTQQRVYWNNKATGITSDVPSEAQLTPALWGRWEFVAP